MYKCICGAEFETVGALGGHKAKCPKYQSILFRVLDSLRESGVLERWFKMKGTFIDILKQYELFKDKIN